jgi:hypothetical protein
MKNEEAKRIAIGLRTDFKCESDTMVDFCNTVIKALEQEPILDKIRAEIIDLSEGWNGMQAKDVPLGAVLKVIDKCKAESEE